MWFGLYPAYKVFSNKVMLRPWPLTLKNNRVPHLKMVIKCTKLYVTLKVTVRSLSRIQGLSTKWCYGLDLWPLTLKNNRVPPLMMVIKCTILVVWPWSLRFGFYPAYKVFLQSDATALAFDLWPWKTIGFLLSWWWSSVPSYMTLKLTVRSLSCLQGFSTKWCYNLDLWPWKQ
jgi:hypothetical protein